MLHMIKLCVGVADVAELARWQEQRLAQSGDIYHITRMVPRRRDELLAGGSLFWVIKGMILVRQKLDDIVVYKDNEGIQRCRLVFDAQLTQVRPTPRRAFQGWRYLKQEDAPRDLSRSEAGSAMPEEMRAELAVLGLL